MKKLSIIFGALAVSAAVLFTSCAPETGLDGTGAEIPTPEVEARELPQSEALDFVKNLKVG